MKLYILDRYQNMVPIGVVGEIYIGGVGLARGYLNRETLNNERFVKNKFEDEYSSRLYKTGDFARYLPDGNIVYLGRDDQQIKLRGFRIELGEIEFALTEHPFVRQAIVVMHKYSEQLEKLIAFIICSSSTDPWNAFIKKLKSDLRNKMPNYMIPAEFVEIKSIPLLSNGKLDREKLLQIHKESSAKNDNINEGVELVTETENLLLDIWKRVLQNNDIMLDDNFFELGGDSIAVLQVSAQARQIGLDITAKQIYQYPEIRQLASILEKRIDENVLFTQEVPVMDIPLTPIQHGFFAQNLKDYHHFNQAVLLECNMRLDIKIVQRTLKTLIKMHPSLRQNFAKKDNTWVQKVFSSDGQDMILNACFHVFEYNPLIYSDKKQIIWHVSKKLQSGLNIEYGPVFQIALLDFGLQYPMNLFITMHHLIIDSVSWHNLLNDFTLIYKENLDEKNEIGTTINFHPKIWNDQLIAYLNLEESKKDLEYWKVISNQSKQKFSTKARELPKVAYRNTQTFQSKSSKQSIVNLIEYLKKFKVIKLSDVLLAVFMFTYAKCFNQDNILIDMEGHGRSDGARHLDLSRSIGWFTGIFPFLFSVNSKDSLSLILTKIIKELNQLPNEGQSFGIFYYLCDDAKVHEILNPLIDVPIAYNYTGKWSSNDEFSQLFSLTNEPFYSSISEVNIFKYHFLINSRIVDNEFILEITFNPNVYNRSSIENFSSEYLRCFEEIPVCDALNDFIPMTILPTKYDNAILQIIKMQCGAVEELYPLFPLQGGLLFHSLYAPEDLGYHVQLALKLQSDDLHNLKLLHQAWQLVCNYYPALQSGIVWKNLSEPMQFVTKKIAPSWIELDWSKYSEDEVTTLLDNLLISDRQQPFHFMSPPLTRLYVVKLDDHKLYIVWCFHHILLDGWSGAIVYSKLLEIYSLLKNGKSFKCDPLSNASYSEWILQQKTPLIESFWKEYLIGLSENKSNTIFSTDSDTSDNGYQTILLNEHISSALMCKASGYQVTLSALVQAIWSRALWLSTNINDLIYGITISGRDVPVHDIEKMVGLFINTLPFRVNVTDYGNVSELAKYIHDQVLRIKECSFASLSEIQSWVGNRKNRNIFSCIYSFQNYPFTKLKEINNYGMRIEEIIDREENEFPLTFLASPGEKIKFTLTFRNNSNNKQLANSIAYHLENICQELTEKEIAIC